jgi:Tfp pilus assembly protein PilO
MKLTPLQQYIILGVVAFLGLTFLYYQFLLKPVNAQITSLQDTLKQKKDKLEEAKKKVANYVEFKKQADSIQRELEWYQNRIPKTVDKEKLLEAISFAQSRSGVVLTNFQFQTLKTSKDYSELPANIRFSSNFSGLIDFLYQTSTSNLLMTVKNLSITPLSTRDHPDFTIQAQLIVSGIQAKQ